MARYAGVRPAGAGIELRWQVRGRRFSRYINTAPTATALQDAARLRKRLIESARLGEDDAAENITFEDACKRALSDLAKRRKPATVATYDKRLSAHWSCFAGKDIREVTKAAIQRADRSQSWTAQKTRKDCLSALSCVLSWAVEMGYLQSNPAQGYEKIRHQRPDVEVFTEAEADAIFEHLKGSPKALYGLMLQTGCRTGELRALTWADVEPDAIRIDGTLWKGEKVETKNYRLRRVFLTAEAKRILKGHTGSRFAGGYVFVTAKGNPYDDSDLTDAFRRACEAAGVRYRRPYTLRHTYASRALTNGVQVAWLATQLGDRVDTVLKHYARWIGGDADMRELAKLERSGESAGIEREAVSDK